MRQVEPDHFSVGARWVIGRSRRLVDSRIKDPKVGKTVGPHGQIATPQGLHWEYRLIALAQ